MPRMTALVVALAAAVAVLGVLVAGLLRSHADILRALHSLGAGVGDPAAPAADASQPVPLRMGPPLPPERDAGRSFPVSGVTPSGDAAAVAVRGGDRLTLFAFLSSGCRTCRAFWDGLRGDGAGALSAMVRPVVVTKGPELEEPAGVAALASPATTVVMSTQAWIDYEVPGSPFFVLVDDAGRRIGEGMAAQVDQVAGLVHRALAESGRLPGAPGPPAVHLDGPAREADNDAALRRAGILPGDPSLYPRSLEDVYGRTAPGPVPSSGAGIT